MSKKRAKPDESSASKKRDQIEQEERWAALAAFLMRCRSIAEVAEEFGLTKKEARMVVLEGLPEVGHDVVCGPTNIHGEETFIAVPADATDENSPPHPRLWRWSKAANDQPYGAVTFLASYKPAKIKIIPIDGIHFGSADHDEEMFEELLQKIAEDDHTFCFLNGDIISEIKGGSREDREQLLLSLAGEFIKKMKPVAHKILWAQQGCLEARSAAQQGFDPLAYFCMKQKIPYFDQPCYIDINWGVHTFMLWAMHGKSTAQTIGAHINTLRRPAVIQNYTHFLVSGHVGDAICNRIVKVKRNTIRGRLDPKEEFHIILGNFKKFLGTTSARKGHQPTSHDILVLNLYPDGKHHVKTAHTIEVSE